MLNEEKNKIKYMGEIRGDGVTEQGRGKCECRNERKKRKMNEAEETVTEAGDFFFIFLVNETFHEKHKITTWTNKQHQNQQRTKNAYEYSLISDSQRRKLN